MENNLEFVARSNNVSIDEVIRIYCSTQYWIASTAFLLGTAGGVALQPEKITINVSKWTVPRKWTYERMVTIAGHSAAVHSIRSPGGYQLIGRTPIDIYDPQQRNPVFKTHPVLFKATDRMEFYPISEVEYHRVRREVEEGTYNYEVEDGIYCVDDYKGEAS